MNDIGKVHTIVNMCVSAKINLAWKVISVQPIRKVTKIMFNTFNMTFLCIYLIPDNDFVIRGSGTSS